MKSDSLARELKAYLKRVDKWFKFIEVKEGTEFKTEQNTIVKFVIPLLEMLGWRPLSEDVGFEYHLKDKRHKTRHVDIALYLSDKNPPIPKILIEVKPIQNDIKNAGEQIFRHQLSGGKVTYAIATNGRELIVFDKWRVRHDAKRGQYAKFS